MNSNYPELSPSMNPVPFEDPSIESCTLSSTRIIDPNTNDFIRDSNGEAWIYQNQIMVKNGCTSTHDGQFQNHSLSFAVSDSDCDIDTDTDTDTDSDDSITSESVDEYEHVEEAPRLQRAYLYIPNDDFKILSTQF